MRLFLRFSNTVKLIIFSFSLDKLTSFFLHAFPTMTCHLFRWRIVDHSMKFMEDSYMGWEAHLVYPFGMYVAWQIGFLVMTGKFDEFTVFENHPKCRI